MFAAFSRLASLNRECLGIALIGGVAATAEEWKPVKLPKGRTHPFLYFNQEEIDWIKQQAKRKGTRQQFEQDMIVAASDKLLPQRLSVLRQCYVGGVRLACDNCLTRQVIFRLDSPKEHRCAACGHLNRGAEYETWWGMEMHARTNRQIRILTWAYLFTGQEVYGEKAKRLLLDYADWFRATPDVGYHRWQVDPQGATRFAAQMANNYDLLYNLPSWTPEERKHFEDDVLRPSLILGQWGQNTRSNHWNTNLLAIGTVGICLEDEELVNMALSPEVGLLGVLRHFDDDGFWHETSLNYHEAVVHDIMQLVEALYHAGIDFYHDERFARIVPAMANLSFQDFKGRGILVGHGDGGNQSLHALGGPHPPAEIFEIYYHRTNDSTVGAVLRGMLRGGYKSLGPLVVADDEWKRDGDDFVLTSVNMPHRGLGVLRAGDKFVLLNYLRRPGGHGHDDRLELVFGAFGAFVGPKLANSDYAAATYGWYHTSIGHNTVSINGSSQGAAADLHYFAAPFDQVQAVSAVSEQKGFSQERTLVLVGDRYLVDLFHAAGAEQGQLDWVYRCTGDCTRPEGSQPFEGEVGYSYLKEVFRLATDETWTTSWTLYQHDAESDHGCGYPPAFHPFDEQILEDHEFYQVKINGRGEKVIAYKNCMSAGFNLSNLMSPVCGCLHLSGPEYPGDKPVGTPMDQRQVPRGPIMGHLRLTMAGEPGTEVFTCDGLGQSQNYPNTMPMVLVRRKVAKTTSMTVLDAYPESQEPTVKSVKQLEVGADAAGLAVETRDSTDTFVANYGDAEIKTDVLDLKGAFAALSTAPEGQVRWALLALGQRLRYGDFVLEAEASTTVQVVRKPDGNWVTSTLNKEGLKVRVHSQERWHVL